MGSNPAAPTTFIALKPPSAIASNYKDNGHAGGDLALVRDFLEAVDTRDFSKLSSSLDASVDSHVMGFACERSRNR